MLKCIREENDQNRACCTVCQKEFGYGGEEGARAQRETEFQVYGMRQANTSESTKSFLFPKKTPMLSPNSGC